MSLSIYLSFPRSTGGTGPSLPDFTCMVEPHVLRRVQLPVRLGASSEMHAAAGISLPLCAQSIPSMHAVERTTHPYGMHAYGEGVPLPTLLLKRRRLNPQWHTVCLPRHVCSRAQDYTARSSLHDADAGGVSVCECRLASCAWHTGGDPRQAGRQASCHGRMDGVR